MSASDASSAERDIERPGESGESPSARYADGSGRWGRKLRIVIAGGVATDLLVLVGCVHYAFQGDEPGAIVMLLGRATLLTFGVRGVLGLRRWGLLVFGIPWIFGGLIGPLFLASSVEDPLAIGFLYFGWVGVCGVSVLLLRSRLGPSEPVLCMPPDAGVADESSANSE